MTSAGWNVPSTVTTPSAHDALDAGAHELDVVLPQAREPRPVVLERPLGGGRVVGDRLGLELGVVAELRARSSSANRSRVARFDCADREPAVVVVGIDA